MRRAFPASVRQVALNYLSAVSLLLPVFVFYHAVPYYRGVITPDGFAGLTFALIGYLTLLPVFYASFPDDYTVKCRRFWKAVYALQHRPLKDAEKVALRAVAVKAFFLPLMVGWSVFHFQNLGESAQTLWGEFSFRHLYMFLFFAVLVGDVGCYTIGYAVEHPKLGNEIRSVEPTWQGWLAALACYPPLHIITARLLGWYAADFPEFDSTLLQIALGVPMLALIAVYSWASLALGLKASNLTHRGVVADGPYAFVRHPAYTAKNLFWVLSALPLLFKHGPSHPQLFLAAGFGLTAWCGLYVWRALTEERHLCRDPEYVAYCERVPYRFIPGLF